MRQADLVRRPAGERRPNTQPGADEESMGVADDFSAVIGALYDAALDAALWPDALRLACLYVGGPTANLIWNDAESPAAGVFHSWGFDTDYQRSYFETYAPLNPVYPAGTFRPVGEVFSSADLIDTDELRASRFYREWVKPQGLADFCNVNLEKSSTATSSFVVLIGGGDGLVDRTMKRRMSLLFPHVKRAVTIGRTLEFHKATSFALSSVLDHVATPIVLTTADGRVAHANRAAERLLSNADMVRLTQGRIAAARPEDDSALGDAIRHLATGGASVPLTDGKGQRHVASLLSLQGTARHQQTGGAEIAIFVRPENPARPTALETIAKAYGLTASEIRMLAAVAGEGGSTAELAERLGIARSTAKTHLLHLHAKTGVKRRGDLVRLLAGAGTAPDGG